MDITVALTSEQVDALTTALTEVNARIASVNERRGVEKRLAELSGTVYTGPEPEPLMTLEQLVQSRLNERIEQDVRSRAQFIASDLAQTFMSADAATREAMLQDWSKYSNRTPPEPVTPSPPVVPTPVPTPPAEPITTTRKQTNEQKREVSVSRAPRAQTRIRRRKPK